MVMNLTKDWDYLNEMSMRYECACTILSISIFIIELGELPTFPGSDIFKNNNDIPTYKDKK